MKTKLSKKLTKLRLEHNLTQKELSEKLDIEIEKIISWENDEVEPSLDDLIKLSDFYHISIDKLVENEPKININKDGIHVVDGDEEVNVSFKDGIYIKTNKDNEEKKVKIEHFKDPVVSILTTIYILLVVVSFLVLGFLIPTTFSVSWTLFLTIPVFESLVKAIKYRKLKKFNISCLVIYIYLSLGMLTTIYHDQFNFSWWHPGWVIFFFIPIWYELIKLDNRINRVGENE